MKSRKIKESVYSIGAQDWDRRLFDALIPLPDGTSYNAYVILGSEKTAVLDSVDPSMSEVLMDGLNGIPSVDYIVSHHAEQDHSGSIPLVLRKYQKAKVLTTSKGKELLMDHLGIDGERIETVADGEERSLGDKTLRFIHTPWVHWPETMCTYLREERILFSCDFFGSHIATTDLFVVDKAHVYEAAKRYYAEIMMPFRATIKTNLEKLRRHPLEIIAPSHGPVYQDPSFILDAYGDWIAGSPKNLVVIPYISMHGSTKRMVGHLVEMLTQRHVTVRQFELSGTDIGRLAIAMVDAATIVIGTPTIHVAPHPAVVYASFLANALHPKLRFASVVGSYGWSSKAVETIVGHIPNLKVEVIEPVLCKGYPREETFSRIEILADTIAKNHAREGFTDCEGIR